MSEWEVRIVGDPNCQHDPQYGTLTVFPPITQVYCRKCSRMLWRREQSIRMTWPEPALPSVLDTRPTPDDAETPE